MERPCHAALVRVVGLIVALACVSASSCSVTAPPRDRGDGRLEREDICDVPGYDPDVALLVGNEVTQYPMNVLTQDGSSAEDLSGTGSDLLRGYIDSPAAVYAPRDGWRAIDSSNDAVTFAAPEGESEWWVVGFERNDEGAWRQVEEQIVEQQPTAAQRGRGLRLHWRADLILRNGAWSSPLELVNERSSVWTDDGGEYWGAPHVFERDSGQEVGIGPSSVGGTGDPYELEPGASLGMLVTLGGAIDGLDPGTYDVVACVPQLGLASPVGTLRITGESAVPEVRVLTHTPSGASMDALGGGELAVENGCLTMRSGGDVTYVVWPQGYQLVRRDDRTVLIDPTGEEIAALGERVQLGGGLVPLRFAEDSILQGLPKACRAGGESYFVTSGPA